MANTTNLDLVKPLGTDHALISVINGNMDKVDAYAGKVNDSLAGVQDGLAIVAVGDTHAAITSGQFVYVKEHNTLPEGLYTASANIAANGALSTSNLTADSNGGLNALSDQIAMYETPVNITSASDSRTINANSYYEENLGNYAGKIKLVIVTWYTSNSYEKMVSIVPLDASYAVYLYGNTTDRIRIEAFSRQSTTFKINNISSSQSVVIYRIDAILG